jgi:LuxR family maltose regulon positive regulatory protein
MQKLLQTKLFIPLLRPNLITRPHLIARLDQGLHPGHKLTLISTPAGFGKTALIAEWDSQIVKKKHHSPIRDPKLCWLSLDEGDNASCSLSNRQLLGISLQSAC